MDSDSPICLLPNHLPHFLSGVLIHKSHEGCRTGYISSASTRMHVWHTVKRRRAPGWLAPADLAKSDHCCQQPTLERCRWFPRGSRVLCMYGILIPSNHRGCDARECRDVSREAWEVGGRGRLVHAAFVRRRRPSVLRYVSSRGYEPVCGGRFCCCLLQ